MKHSNLIRKIQIQCPLCGQVHEIEHRVRIVRTIIKEEETDYTENYYLCLNSDADENEFATGAMENQNLLNAHNAYRTKHQLLTSDEIVALRKAYGLSQVDLARLLGWGEATISRYESKAIQDEAYDNILRAIQENPLVALDYLQKNREKFTVKKSERIKQRIIAHLDEDGKEYLQRRSLESEYITYQTPCNENGFKLLDIDKVELMVSYFAKRINNLYKVKLMKLLWYADALFFKRYGNSISGLVYRHDTMGALPVGHYKLVGLENINKQIEEDYEYTKYHFLPNNKISESVLSSAEKQVLNTVIQKFVSFNAQEIVSYMHEETAYVKTADNEVIPFSLAREIREF